MQKLTKVALILTACSLPIQEVVAKEDLIEQYLSDIYNYFSVIPEPKPIVNKWVAISSKNITTITAGDNINIKIDPTSKEDIKLYAPATGYYTDGSSLNLYSNSVSKEKYNVKLKSINLLENIVMNGNATIEGKDLKKDDVALNIKTTGNSIVNIQGMIKLKSLSHHSKNKTEITWVDADKLNIDVASGTVKLAGTANDASIWSYGQSVVDIPHLRTKNTWIATQQNSHVFSNPIGYFYAHAQNNSLIEHRGNFKTISVITKDLANVILHQL